jgi:hypothetical protein
MPSWVRLMVTTLSGSGFVPVSIQLDGNFCGHEGRATLRAVLDSAMARACSNLSINFNSECPRVWPIIIGWPQGIGRPHDLIDLMEPIMDWLHSPLESPVPLDKGRVLMVWHNGRIEHFRSFFEAINEVILINFCNKKFKIFYSPFFQIGSIT